MSLSRVHSLAALLIEHKPLSLRLTQSGYVSSAGAPYFRTGESFQKWLLEKYPSYPKISEAFSKALQEYSELGKGITLLCSDVLSEISKQLLDQKESVSLEDLPPTEASHGVPLSQVTLVKLNMENGAGLVRFGEDSAWEPVDCNDFLSQVRADYAGEAFQAALANWISNNSSPHVKILDPFLPSGQQEKTRAKLRRFNVYVRPQFLRDWNVESDFERKHPSTILNYLEKLLPNEQERDYVLCRLYNVAAKRSAVVLVLAGAPKTGKTTYMELERALVGEENYRSLSVGQDESLFDGYLAVSRLIHRDEPNLTRPVIERLKNNVNDVIGVSEKQEKTIKQKPVKNHCSFTVAMNIEGKTFSFEFEDRKFYVPLISEPPLDGSSPYTPEEYENIKNAMTDIEKLRDLYAYLYKYYKDKPHSPDAPKTESFFRLCHAKFGTEKLGMLECASKGSAEPYFPPQRRNAMVAKTAKTFLIQYRQQVGIDLGKIVGSGSDWHFKANENLTEVEKSRLVWFLGITSEIEGSSQPDNSEIPLT